MNEVRIITCDEHDIDLPQQIALRHPRLLAEFQQCVRKAVRVQLSLRAQTADVLQQRRVEGVQRTTGGGELVGRRGTRGGQLHQQVCKGQEGNQTRAL